MGSSDKATQRLGWMIERMLDSYPGSNVKVDYGGERRDGSLYQATLVTPQGHHVAPCAKDAFEAVQVLYQTMATKAHMVHREARNHLRSMGLDEPTPPSGDPSMKGNAE